MKKIREMIKSFKLKWPTYKKILIGNSNHHGLLYKIAIYFLSITFAFVFLYPIFYMFMISLMSNTDLVDSTILWIPSSIHWENYQFGLRGLFMDQTYIKYLSEFFTVLDVNGELLNGTFADANMNHNGYIYQATNWIYTGESTPKYKYIFEDGSTFDIRRGIDKKGKVRNLTYSSVLSSSSSLRTARDG